MGKHINSFNDRMLNENTDNMKDMIIQALNNAFVLLEKQVPQTKNITIQVSISDVEPLELVKFMKDKNIPDNATFGGIDNGYDGYSDICLDYSRTIPTTDKEKLEFKKKRFTDIAWKFVYDILTNSNYKRKGYNSDLYKQFKDTTVYDMYINKEYDRLVLYYSQRFNKE